MTIHFHTRKCKCYNYLYMEIFLKKQPTWPKYCYIVLSVQALEFYFFRYYGKTCAFLSHQRDYDIFSYLFSAC